MNEEQRSQQKFCVIVPAYLEAGRIGKVVTDIKRHARDVVVIDDGSTDGTAEEAAAAGAHVIRHPENRGKGAALDTGFVYAREHNFDYLITMDADGQHDPDDIPTFVEAYQRTGITVLVGNRMDKTDNMPLVRRWTNRIMSWYLSRAMRQYVPDSQCGFRLYRCDQTPYIATESTRYAAESEILLHVAARGIRIDSVPIAVIYHDEKSKISPVRDTLRFVMMIHRHRKRTHVRRRT
ncbi:MAG: glycosyltransferase family 2 protein [Kiritimatiellia bacterium]|nr:glycosyltransferase family 2 protein [Lentisphaerota bacterium]